MKRSISARDLPRFGAAILLALGMIGSAGPARASCIVDANPRLRSLQTLVLRDANQAVAQAGAQIASAQAAAHPDPAHLAALYAVQAQAYSELELNEQARATAERGLGLLPNPGDPVHVDLLTAYADNVYDAAATQDAATRLEAARGEQVRGSAADLCLLISLGRVQRRQDRDDLAFRSLQQAYDASYSPQLTGPHVQAAAELAAVMRAGGDNDQALQLNREVLDWDTRLGATLDLSVTRYINGRIHESMGANDDALADFSEARRLSALVGDRQGIAYADMERCRVEIELRRYGDAEKHCASAADGFGRTPSSDTLQLTHALQARLALETGHAAEALNRLDGVLAPASGQMLPADAALAYLWRARANAALGRYRAAYEDLATYSRQRADHVRRERTAQAAVLRARFQIDQEMQRNAALESALGAAREREIRQSDQLRVTVGAIVVGLAITALLVYVLVINLRHRRELLRLADQDVLTGLPNRRHMVQLATAALERAAQSGEPLTMALIDLDHFKAVNDRCGHAEGDRVLQEFARIGRLSLRAADILGRWGGEEFLLVLPVTALDVALSVIERLRQEVLAIVLPACADGVGVSFSAGLAARGARAQTLDEIVANADAALYEAKNAGRDLVRIDRESERAASTGVRRALAKSLAEHVPGGRGPPGD